MFGNWISLILIAAVVICPMSCGNGVCQAATCCAATVEESSTRSCQVHGTSTCCCDDVPEQEDSPQRCPSSSTCQGICGGAVIQKPSELDGNDASFFRPSIDNDGLTASPMPQVRLAGAEQGDRITAEAHGRFVRILHSSLLC